MSKIESFKDYINRKKLEEELENTTFSTIINEDDEIKEADSSSEENYDNEDDETKETDSSSEENSNKEENKSNPQSKTVNNYFKVSIKSFREKLNNMNIPYGSSPSEQMKYMHDSFINVINPIINSFKTGNIGASAGQDAVDKRNSDLSKLRDDANKTVELNKEISDTNRYIRKGKAAANRVKWIPFVGKKLARNAAIAKQKSEVQKDVNSKGLYTEDVINEVFGYGNLLRGKNSYMTGNRIGEKRLLPTKIVNTMNTEYNSGTLEASRNPNNATISNAEDKFKERMGILTKREWTTNIKPAYKKFKEIIDEWDSNERYIGNDSIFARKAATAFTNLIGSLNGAINVLATTVRIFEKGTKNIISDISEKNDKAKAYENSHDRQVTQNLQKMVKAKNAEEDAIKEKKEKLKEDEKTKISEASKAIIDAIRNKNISDPDKIDDYVKSQGIELPSTEEGMSTLNDIIRNHLIDNDIVKQRFTDMVLSASNISNIYGKTLKTVRRIVYSVGFKQNGNRIAKLNSGIEDFLSKSNNKNTFSLFGENVDKNEAMPVVFSIYSLLKNKNIFDANKPNDINLMSIVFTSVKAIEGSDEEEVINYIKNDEKAISKGNSSRSKAAATTARKIIETNGNKSADEIIKSYVKINPIKIKKQKESVLDALAKAEAEKAEEREKAEKVAKGLEDAADKQAGYAAKDFDDDEEPRNIYQYALKKAKENK